MPRKLHRPPEQVTPHRPESVARCSNPPRPSARPAPTSGRWSAHRGKRRVRSLFIAFRSLSRGGSRITRQPIAPRMLIVRSDRHAPVRHPAGSGIGQPLECDRQRAGDSPQVAGLLPPQADVQRPAPSQSCQSSANSGTLKRMVASARAPTHVGYGGNPRSAGATHFQAVGGPLRPICGHRGRSRTEAFLYLACPENCIGPPSK